MHRVGAELQIRAHHTADLALGTARAPPSGLTGSRKRLLVAFDGEPLPYKVVPK